MLQCSKIRRREAGSRDDDEIKVGRELCLRQAKELATDALAAIAQDGVADFFGHDDAQACGARAIDLRSDQHDEVGRVESPAAILNGEKLAAPEQPARLVERKCDRGSYFLAIVTTRFLRPFLRRRLIVRRPPTVFIRLRNPWVRLRRLFEG